MTSLSDLIDAERVAANDFAVAVIACRYEDDDSVAAVEAARVALSVARFATDRALVDGAAS